MGLRFIKKINREDNINLLQILKMFVFDDAEISLYIEGKEYNMRSLVVKFSQEQQRLILYSCRVESSSLLWNDSEWVKETALGKTFKVEDFLIQMSAVQPIQDENRLWYEKTDDRNNGSFSVQTRLRNANNEYDTLFVKSTTSDVYVDFDKNGTLEEKLKQDDIDFTIVRQFYINDMTRLIKVLTPLLPKGMDLDFIHLVDLSDTSQVSIEGGLLKDGVIIL